MNGNEDHGRPDRLQTARGMIKRNESKWKWISAEITLGDLMSFANLIIRFTFICQTRSRCTNTFQKNSCRTSMAAPWDRLRKLNRIGWRKWSIIGEDQLICRSRINWLAISFPGITFWIRMSGRLTRVNGNCLPPIIWNLIKEFGHFRLIKS